jgi:putative ABC transport system ATP-binding protein
MLETNQLSFSYSGNATLKFPNFSCKKGEHWLLLGQSGSGKTTLLHLLGGLLSPSAGSVKVGDTDLKSLSTADLDKFRGKHIGIIFQKSHFVRALTVQENLLLAQQLAGVPSNKGKIAELLNRLNIGHKLHAKTNELSQGEQQRVAIARALVNQPQVILADEPTSALDDENCEEVIQLLEEQAAAAEATLLVVTHDGRLKERFEHQIIIK